MLEQERPLDVGTEGGEKVGQVLFLVVIFVVGLEDGVEVACCWAIVDFSSGGGGSFNRFWVGTF